MVWTAPDCSVVSWDYSELWASVLQCESESQCLNSVSTLQNTSQTTEVRSCSWKIILKASALNILSSAITNTLSFELSWHRAFRKNYKFIINIHGCVLYKYLEYSIFCKYLNISPQHDNSIFDTCHLSFQNQYYSLCHNLCQIVQISYKKSRNLRYILCLFLCSVSAKYMMHQLFISTWSTHEEPE